MKSIRNITLSVLLTLAAFATVTYTACSKDECKDVVCQNGGTCVGGECSCPSGFEGANCEIQSRFRFLTNNSTATYITGVGQDGCFNAGYNMTIAPASGAADEIVISNFAGYGNTATVSGVKVDGLNFTKTGTVTAGAVTLSNISGSINSAGTEITFTYRATDANGSINCTSSATKQ